MQDFIANLLSYGGLLFGYGLALAAYLRLRIKAQRESAGRPIFQVQRWKSFCYFLSRALLMVATIWSIAIALSFADLVLSLDEVCLSLITQDECYGAASSWQQNCIIVADVAFPVFVLTVGIVLREAKCTDSPPEHSYSLPVLTCSHFLLVVSSLMCTPLSYPLKLFNLTGTNHWISASLVLALIAVLAYILGTALWIVALARIFFAWRHRSRNRTPAGWPQWPGGLERDIALQEV